MTDQNKRLENLAAEWRHCKLDEENARKARVEIEEQIVELTGCREEGSKTHDAGNYKVSVTGKLNRNLDAAKWEEIKDRVPEALRPVDYKPTLDTKGLRYLENNEPEVARVVSEAIETKPGKTAVEVK